MCIKKNKTLIKIFISFIVVSILFFSKFQILRISGESMEPTFKNNQITLLIKNITVNRNDIVVFKKESTVYIKRVIAKSGDYVELCNGYIYINGVKQMPYTYDGNNIEYTLHENQYFVIGDNYQNSIDSRVFGLITSTQIIGKPIK